MCCDPTAAEGLCRVADLGRADAEPPLAVFFDPLADAHFLPGRVLHGQEAATVGSGGTVEDDVDVLVELAGHSVASRRAPGLPATRLDVPNGKVSSNWRPS